jgi:hypothetical protein
MTEPIQFGAPAAPAVEPAIQVPPIVEQPAPETPAEAPAQVLVEGAVDDAAELVQDAQPVVEQFVHTHQSVLSDLMSKLEGIMHLGKSEIVAVVAEARERFEKL